MGQVLRLGSLDPRANPHAAPAGRRSVLRPLQTDDASAVPLKVDADTEHMDDLAARAELLVTLRRYEEALRLACALVGSQPDDVRSWTLLARCQSATGQHRAAATSARQAVALAPHSARLRLWSSQVLSAAGRRADALEAAESAVRLAPGEVATHAAVATCAADLAPTGDVSAYDQPLWRLARWHANEALRLDAADTGALFAVAYVNLRAGQNARARRGFRAVLAAEPTNEAAQNNLAVLEMRRLRLRRSGRALAGLAGSNPQDRRATRNVGRVVTGELALAHALFWLLYVCNASLAAIASPDWRGPVVVVSLIGLTVYLAHRWRHAAAGLRRFAFVRLLSRRQRLVVAACDAVMLSVLLVSAVSAGRLAWVAPAVGLVGAVPTTVILCRARPD